MRTRILLCAGIVLFLGGALHAGDWKPLNNNLWSDPDNWSTGLLPVPGERTTINDPPECHLDIETLIGNLQISDGGALMIADGGILTAYGWVHVGKNNEGSLTVTNGGVLMRWE